MTSCIYLILIVASLSYLVPSYATQACQYNYSYVDGVTGNFSSPMYPDYYPSLLRCAYYFDASRNGGVEIKFLTFELEDKKEGDDKYDYIDVFTVDSNHFMTFLNRFCGRKIPHTVISPQSKLLIKFVTDHWQNSETGFFGSYRFLGDEWQPFEEVGSTCGNNNLTGVAGFIYSPHYPHSYPANLNCSWTIRVPTGHQIVVRIQDMDIGDSGRCGDAKLRLYNGYTTTMSVHTREWCGRHSSYSTQALKYVSNNNKVILRFFPGHSNLRGHRGFKLLWMAVTLPETTEPCAGFRCKGGRHCHNGAECTPLKQYCISKSLVCDGVRNCGPFDDSDERKCTREVIIMASCIAVPSLILLMMMVVLVVYCQKRRDVVSKSTSQDQPLANSHSQGTASRESFTSNNRQTMVHTSFMDGAGVNDHDYDREFKDIDEETTHGLFSSDGAAPTNNSLRTHKKRPSYHMMQQNYEDGNLIISQI